jgi:UDP-N-acetyl-D-mannosaminuronic acid dehydrogenase
LRFQHPSTRTDRSPNLDYIYAATDALAPVLACGNIVNLEWTSPVGATERAARRLARLQPDLRFPPGHHAERLDVHVAHLPGAALAGPHGARADRE